MTQLFLFALFLFVQEPDHAAHAQAPGEPVPALTDADRAAAFPDLGGHTVHDRGVNFFVLFDQFEWQTTGNDDAVSWDNKGWIGGDIHRFWFRTEGEGAGGEVEEGDAHFLYGRAFSPWWDFVAGIRQDINSGPSRTWAAAGIQGLAPYFFELEATAYLGTSGRTLARVEAEYELLITNRLILQPLAEIELAGKSDIEGGIDRGFTEGEAGFRLRYEVRREFAPYVGFVWNRKFGGTADLARINGHDAATNRFTSGIRIWF
jgi:copper resistance protein B